MTQKFKSRQTDNKQACAN